MIASLNLFPELAPKRYPKAVLIRIYVFQGYNPTVIVDF
jgi:hypothetical protein